MLDFLIDDAQGTLVTSVSSKALYDSKIDQWMDDRGITENGTAMAQAIKTLEETTEFSMR